jgi:D-alanine-D-alanine ligase
VVWRVRDGARAVDTARRARYRSLVTGRRILILWNQPEEDVYERWRAEGPQPLEWDPSRNAPDVTTVLEEIDAIVDAVRAGGHEVTIVNIHDDFRTIIKSIDEFHPDAIVNLVEFYGDDVAYEAHIPGLYELMGIAYTGSRPSALATCLRKHRTKALLAQAGLPTAPYIVVDPRNPDPPEDHGLSFPLIVKPAQEDASSGIDLGAVVNDQPELEARVAMVLRDHDMAVLIEEYIDGRELHCAILGNDPPVALPLYEMVFQERTGADGKALPKIVTFRAKWDPHSRDFFDVDGHCPVDDLDPEIIKGIQDVAVRSAQIVGVRDYARVDMRIDPVTGDPFVLEVNPNPDLAEHGAFMQCAIASGRTFTSTINEIVSMALDRADHHAPSPLGDQLLREHLEQRHRRAPTVPPKRG